MPADNSSFLSLFPFPFLFSSILPNLFSSTRSPLSHPSISLLSNSLGASSRARAYSGPSGRKPAGFRRRTGTGGVDGARGHANAAAACSEEHHVRYIDESSRRPCIDIREHIVIIIECADRLGAVINPLGGFGGVSPAMVVTSMASNQQEDLLGLF